MTPAALLERVVGRYQRTLSAHAWRRPVLMQNTTPLVSFTFDDFPTSALEVGGALLRGHGVAGTYYTALGLLDRSEPVGRICAAEDLARVLAQGHELGCHTFGHCDAWGTPSADFEASILENRRALARVLPGATFETMSYPINSPRPETKRRTGRYFAACRGGGQCTNAGTADLNYLFAFFLEQARDREDVIRGAIEANRAARGWLIFVTHDVAAQPSRFGCTPELFARVIRWSLESGARILPVGRAVAAVCGRPAASSAEGVAAGTESPHAG
jgi:peptidoglycan/xylan/chitin deacetylase (PgdA/CDA1 family)